MFWLIWLKGILFLIFKQNLNMNEFWDTLCTEYILYSLQFLFVKRDFCKYQHLINSDNTAKNLAQHYKKIAFSASTIEKRPIEMPDWSLSCLRGGFQTKPERFLKIRNFEDIGKLNKQRTAYSMKNNQVFIRIFPSNC